MVTRAELQQRTRTKTRRTPSTSGRIDVSQKAIQQISPETQAQFDKEKAILQQKISDLEAQDKALAVDMKLISAAIARDTAQTGSEPKAAVARLNQLSRERSSLAQRKDILKTSQSTAEASLRGSALKQSLALAKPKADKKLDKGTTVMIGGQGFSVRESEKERFIREKTGQQAFENILTGERVSARESPGTLFKEVRVTPSGQKISEGVGAIQIKTPDRTPLPKNQISRAVALQDRWEAVTKDINKLEGAEQAKRIREIEKLGGEVDAQGNIKAPTIKIGFGKNKKEVSIDEIDARTKSDAAFSIAGILSEEGLIKLGKDAGLKDIPITIPERKSIFFEPIFGTKQIDPLTGEKIFFKEKEIIIPEKKLSVGIEDVAAATRFGFETIAFIPQQVGALGEETIKAKGDITKVGQVILKERKLDTAILGTVAITGGVSLLARPILKTTVKGIKLTTRLDEIAGKRIILSGLREGGKLKVLPSERFLVKTEREVLIKPKEQFIEPQRLIIKGEEQAVISKPIIFETPRLTKEVTTISEKGAKKLGKEAETIIDFKISKPRVTEPFAGKPVIEGKPFIFRSARVGKGGKLGEPSFTFIEGTQKVISPEDIAKLPKETQFLITETISKTKLQGRPVSTKDVGKLIAEEEQIVLGKIRTFQPTKPLGSKTDLQQAVAIVSPKGKVGGLEILDVQTGFKGVSKPFARPTGKIETRPGIVVRLPAKDITPTDTSIITPTQITKTPLETTFALQEIQTLKIPKPTKPKPTKPKIKQELVEEVTTKPTSMFPLVSAAQVDVTQKVLPLQVGQLTLQPDAQIGIQQPALIQQPQLDIKQISITQPSLAQQPILTQIQQPSIKLGIQQAQVPKQKLEVQQIPALKLKVEQAQAIKQVPVQRQRVKQPTPKIKPTIKPKIVPPLPLSRALQQVKKAIKEKPEEFKVFVRKDEKDIKVKTLETADEARKFLRQRLKNTLRASGFIQDKSGKRINPFGFGLANGEFRRSKKEPKRLVQRKGRRFGTGLETTEAQFFRGLKKGKSLF